MINRIIAILFLTFIIVTCIILFFPALFIWLVTLPFDKKKIILHQYTCFWGALYTWVNPAWRIHIIDRHKFQRGKVYVVVSNHQSQLDILVAFNLFRHFKWVSKIEIFKVPFVGWNMYLNRYVRLVRGDKESIAEMMRVSEERLREGSSVFIFPEGTRSADGRVQKFKPGAFILAHKLKLPILPIAISGTTNALPKHSMNFHGVHNLYLKVLDEVPYEAFANMSIEDTAEFILSKIIEGVDSLLILDKERSKK